MNKTQVAKKLSRALMNTTDISVIPKVIDELRVFSKLIDSDRKIRLFFTSEMFSDEEKKKALEAVLSYMKASVHTGRFLTLMMTQGSLMALKETIKALYLLYEMKLRKVTAEVAAPVALSEQYVSRLVKALSSLTNRNVEITSRLDRSLIGGFVVKVGSTVYDSSLKGQLQLLRTELTRQ